MWRILSKSILLLSVSVLICCVLYPLALWAVGQTLFPFQANGSIINGPDGKPVGSRLIAQPFTKDEFVSFARDYLGVDIIFWAYIAPWLQEQPVHP